MATIIMFQIKPSDILSHRVWTASKPISILSRNWLSLTLLLNISYVATGNLWYCTIGYKLSHRFCYSLVTLQWLLPQSYEYFLLNCYLSRDLQRRLKQGVIIFTTWSIHSVWHWVEYSISRLQWNMLLCCTQLSHWVNHCRIVKIVTPCFNRPSLLCRSL